MLEDLSFQSDEKQTTRYLIEEITKILPKVVETLQIYETRKHVSEI